VGKPFSHSHSYSLAFLVEDFFTMISIGDNDNDNDNDEMWNAFFPDSQPQSVTQLSPSVSSPYLSSIMMMDDEDG